jgi:hypothetical protein
LAIDSYEYQYKKRNKNKWIDKNCTPLEIKKRMPSLIWLQKFKWTFGNGKGKYRTTGPRNL